MSNWKWLLLLLGTVLITAGGRIAPAQSSGGAGVIQGTIKSADGGPMEGVVVSARASDKSFTTSVFSDRLGNYVFPSLDAGQYRLWAQAVGFEAARSELALTATGVSRSLTMVPIKDVGRIVKQMSGVEFLRSLPQSTAADRRMVHAYKNNCTGCHTASHALGNRWDAAGWGVLIDLMTVFPSTGEPVAEMRPNSGVAEGSAALTARVTSICLAPTDGTTSTMAATGRWGRHRASSAGPRTTCGSMAPAMSGWRTTWCPIARLRNWTHARAR